LQGFEYIQKIEKLIRVSLGRNRARPSCTARVRPTATQAYSPRPRGRSPTRPRPAQRARPSSAVQRSARRARRRRCCMAASRWRLTGARETAGENVAQLTEAWTTAWHDGVDSGVGWHGERGRRRHGGSATTDSELRGRVRGLARSEVRDTGGGNALTSVASVDGGIDGSGATASVSDGWDAARSGRRTAVRTRHEGRGELG
jgi:hypothetical protein